MINYQQLNITIFRLETETDNVLSGSKTQTY